MDIKVYFSTSEVTKRMLSGRGVIIIDVLRATTTLISALANGAERIIPVESVAQAKIESRRYPKGNILLGGERGYEKLEGFDLGNSPREYNRDTVSGKSIVYTSTNGTKGIILGKAGETTTLGAFVNFPRAADYLLDISRDISIVCCGTSGTFSLEDAVCGGMFVHYIMKNVRSATTNDAAEASVALFKRYRESIPQMMEMCENGRHLSLLGFQRDVVDCSSIGNIDMVPLLYGDEVVPYTT